ncbi:MAG: ABC transporter ATP-binding protein [Nitriliruptorales bacterium]|nr:ABC transporter ATP-binding protein [Nitriliruptorales bacterium]
MASPYSTPQGEVVVAEHVTREFADDGGVWDLDLEVPRGLIFGLVGPSGSGKTTAVQLILGLLEPDDGELTVFGQDPTELSREDRARIGYLPQESVLYPELSLRHNLHFVASTYGMPWRPRFLPKSDAGKKARRRIDEVLELLDLENRRRHRLADLSGGEKRRLALATALVHDPDLLVLDEPTTGIDPVLRQDLWRHFAALRDDLRTMFVTTQYVSEAAYCDLVALMVDGRVLTVGTPGDLQEDAFGGPMLAFEFSRPLSAAEAEEIEQFATVVTVSRGAQPRTLRAAVTDPNGARLRVRDWAADHDVDVVGVSEADPSFDEVFVELVRRHRDGDGQDEQ